MSFNPTSNVNRQMFSEALMNELRAKLDERNCKTEESHYVDIDEPQYLHMGNRKTEKPLEEPIYLELCDMVRPVSVVDTSPEAKSAGEGKKSFLTRFLNAFNLIKDAVIEEMKYIYTDIANNIANKKDAVIEEMKYIYTDIANNIANKIADNSTNATNAAKSDAVKSIAEKRAAAVAQNNEIFELITNSEEHLSTEGILRKSGAQHIVKDISQGTKSLNHDDVNLHALGSLFKQNLKEHLTPEDKKNIENLFNDYKASNSKNVPRLEALPEMAQKAILLTQAIVRYSEQNQMNPSNLATCIGPNMISEDHTSELSYTFEFNKFVKEIIEQSVKTG